MVTPGLQGVTLLHRCYCDETEPLPARPTHLALNRTLAQPIPLPGIAGGLLSHRFTHHPKRAGLLSVAVVVKVAFQRFALTYCFVRRSCPDISFRAESREVPLPKSIG